MIHLGKNTKSRIVLRGSRLAKAENPYRGLVRIAPRATNARNHSQRDSLLIGEECGAHTFPYADVLNSKYYRSTRQIHL